MIKSGSIQYIISGLGNPDRKYEYTRHNAGWLAVDYMAEHLNCKINKVKFKSYVCRARIGDADVLLMKPSTYMNNSGIAVAEAMRFYKLPPERVIVVFDDISLDVGKMRIRSKGSDGGQRGMRSIMENCGSSDFPRIKIGIGAKPNPQWDLADWVLSKFTDDELKKLDVIFGNVLDASSLMISGRTDRAMSLYN